MPYTSTTDSDSEQKNMLQQHYAGAAGGAATTDYLKIRVARKSFLRSVQFVVTTAGGGATHKFEVYVTPVATGTPVKKGEYVLGTSVARTVAELAFNTAANPEVTVEMGDQINVKSGADATGVAEVTYLFQTHVNSAMTAPY